VAKFPRRWSIVLWLIFIPFAVATTFLEPLIIEPIFNKVQIMSDGPLKRNISRLAQAAGLPGAPVFVVDKSKQTEKINAYVTGIGSSARIVIWDNTINRLPADQVLAVVGHELGHYALGHIYWGLLMVIGGQLLILLIAQKYAAAFIARLPVSWKLQGLHDMAIIPVIMLVSTLALFVADPVINAISRYQEHQADAYGLKLTGNGPAMASCFVSLAQQNLSEPDPPKWIEWWLFSHPTLRDRIEFALRH
jgi:Zn-dependent protease with chaperone function